MPTIQFLEHPWIMSNTARSPVDEQHLRNLRSRVASSNASQIIKSAERRNGALKNVYFVLSRPGRGPGDHEQFVNRLLEISRNIKPLIEAHEEVDARDVEWLFAIAQGPPHRENDLWSIILIASSEEILKKAVVRLNIKFLGRVNAIENAVDPEEENTTWLGQIKESATPKENEKNDDETRLWDVVRKTSSPHALNPSRPPCGARSVARLVAHAQSRLERLSPDDAFEKLEEGSTSSSRVVLIDIRTAVQRAIYGAIPSAIHINRVHLEFALDPQSPERLPIVEEHKYGLFPIVFDQNGSASSLAAASLHDLGLLQATDIAGGFDAWKKAGRPTVNDYS